MPMLGVPKMIRPVPAPMKIAGGPPTAPIAAPAAQLGHSPEESDLLIVSEFEYW